MLFSVSRLKYYVVHWKCEEVGDTIRRLVFQVTHRRPPSRIWTSVPIQTNLSLYSRWLKSSRLQRKCGGARRASSKCRHWEIHEKVKDWIDQIIQVEPPTRSRDMTRNHVTDLVGNVLWQVISIFSVCCFCVNMACLFPSHRAAKKRNDKVSCERPHSY